MAVRLPRRRFGLALARFGVAGVVGFPPARGYARTEMGADDVRDATGCPDPTASDDAPAELGTVVEVSGVRVRLDLDDAAAVGANALSVRVVRATAGEPAIDGIVFVTTRMPSMDHGESGYVALGPARGVYRVEGVSLGMAGDWLVTVHVIRQARAPIAVTYRVEMPTA